MTENAPKSDGAAGAAGETPVMPLFYTQPEVLRKDAHANLGLKKQGNYLFTKDANAVPITVSEFPMASIHYPIIFVGEERKTPVAVLSYERGKNFFVNNEGKWEDTAYIPAYVRRYPFVFMRDDANNRFALCIDRGSELIAEADDSDTVQPFFKDGEETELTQNALQFCTAYQQEANATEQFVQILQKHNLIETRSANLTLKDGQTATINNIGVVDEQKVNDLDRKSVV